MGLLSISYSTWLVMDTLTLSNRVKSSCRAGLRGSLRKLANSSIVILPPLQEQAMLAKLSNSFFTLSHFNLNLNRKPEILSLKLAWNKSYDSLFFHIVAYIWVKWLLEQEIMLERKKCVQGAQGVKKNFLKVLFGVGNSIKGSKEKIQGTLL